MLYYGCKQMLTFMETNAMLTKYRHYKETVYLQMLITMPITVNHINSTL